MPLSPRLTRRHGGLARLGHELDRLVDRGDDLQAADCCFYCLGPGSVVALVVGIRMLGWGYASRGRVCGCEQDERVGCVLLPERVGLVVGGLEERCRGGGVEGQAVWFLFGGISTCALLTLAGKASIFLAGWSSGSRRKDDVRGRGVLAF